MQNNIRLTKLFVSKFGPNATHDQIQDAFAKFGQIYDCRVNLRNNSATVCYRNPEDAEKAISTMNGQEQLGGILVVEHTHKRSSYQQDGDSRPPYGGSRYHGDRDHHSRERDRGSEYQRRDYGRDRGDFQPRGDYGRRDFDNRPRYGNDERSQTRGPPRYENDRGGYRGNDRSGGDRYSDRPSGGDRFNRPDRQQSGGDRYLGERNFSRGGGEDRDRPFKERTCYNCQGTGHISKNCPNGRSYSGNSGSSYQGQPYQGPRDD